MKIRIFSMNEYGCFFKSLVRLHNMPVVEAIWLTYTLNTANIDTARGNGNQDIMESSMERFCSEIQRRGYPYQTATKFFRACEILEKHIQEGHITADQREALHNLRRIMEEIGAYYHEAHGHDIDDRIHSTYWDVRQDLLSHSFEPIEETRPKLSVA